MNRLICFGDSITDCGRFFDAPPLGNGYVKMTAKKLKKHKNDIIVINRGFDGFTVRRVLDNIKSQPIPAGSICTLLIGINDIGLMMNTNRTPEQKTEMMKVFADTYEDVIRLVMARADKLILIEPFLFPCPAELELWISHIYAMSDIIRTLADKYRLSFLSLHSRLNRLASQNGFEAVTVDGIHLTTLGHRVISDELLKLL